MKEIQVTKYISVDGKEFTTRQECEQHEAKGRLVARMERETGEDNLREVFNWIERNIENVAAVVEFRKLRPQVEPYVKGACSKPFNYEGFEPLNIREGAQTIDFNIE